jgi:hypothetical protein
MDLAPRLAALDWPRIGADLAARGAAATGVLITDEECHALRALWPREEAFRSRIVMARHGYGQGEYGYFRDPLPPLVAALRGGLWPHLMPTANAWAEALGEPRRFPADHADFRAECHAAGQTRPTPLLLRYGPGDWNALHQDLYGDLAFPLQVAFLLSEPERDFTGGEFVLTEQRPRQQSRPEVVRLRQGEGVVFATNRRPAQGARGSHAVRMRHGVSRLHGGERFTLGIIFHDAA